MAHFRNLLTPLALSLGAAFAGTSEAQPTYMEVSDDDRVTTSTSGDADLSDAIYWRLEGGGEIVGKAVKDTPLSVFIDIGPSIIEVPTEDILTRTPLSSLRESQMESPAGMGTGFFDEETGSLIFKSRDGGSELLSQQEVLEKVKQAVVLVSNPGGLGTGWIIDESGRLVTNHHVTGEENYQTVTIFVKRGDSWEKERIDNCEVEAFSSLYDIAVVQLDMEEVERRGIELHTISIAEPGELEAGDVVYAVGNPGMGSMVLDHTISEGIVSSLARNFNDVIYLQTTAAVNPGNSGGPLVNRRGEVVGLVTLKAFFQEGVAFALPVDYIRLFLTHANAYSVTEMNPNKGYRYYRPQ